MEYRFEGEAVKIRRVGKGVLLEPMGSDVDGFEVWTPFVYARHQRLR
jgi:virulence-associated protein VagC